MTQVLRSNLYRHLRSSITIIIFLKYIPLVFEETLILSLLTEHEKNIQKHFFQKKEREGGDINGWYICANFINLFRDIGRVS
jgi:hypothetical protein